MRSAVVAVSVALLASGDAEARPVTPTKPVAKKGCNTHSCVLRVRRKHKLRYIKPHRGWFLGPVGACESGTGSHKLNVGLQAVDPWGKYRGRYQFGMPDWHRAGGKGDPINAGWLEQAYRAVRWLHINGRSSWPNC